MQSAINATFPLALGIFEEGEYEAELKEAGIFEGESALKHQWLEKVTSELAKYGYTLPAEEDVTLALGGRKGFHTEHLQPLLNEMSEVFQIDPGADW
jgi:ring-1,2-phenylacetyl-CoA epoxidase subunit PaaC